MEDLILANGAVLRDAILNKSVNTSTTLWQDNDDLFFTCWRHFSCESCLAELEQCAWCSLSQVCVPNTDFQYPFGILTPIKRQDICPLSWRERWEMRAKPFPCRCSTMTLMSVVVAVLSTLIGVLLIWLFIKFTKWIHRKWKTREDGWWRFWQWRPRRLFFVNARCCGRRKGHNENDAHGESRPLLGTT